MKAQYAAGNASKRIVIIDSLRGFSLFGILISHSSILFEAFDTSTLSTSEAPISSIVVSILNGIFFSGKFFAIFSFLFGLSFFIQMDRAAQKGINYRWRFLWRIIILMFVGYLHSLLFSGDILIIYAVLGVFLVFLFKARDKVLVLLIIILLSGIPRYISYGVQNIPGTVIKKIEISSMEAQLKAMSKLYREGSLVDVVKFNAVKGLIIKAEYQLGIEGRGYQTLALFLLGVLVGRKRYFERVGENIPLTRKIFTWSIWLTLGFLVIGAGLFALSKGDMDRFSFHIAMTFYNLFNLTMALLITTGFIILYHRGNWQRIMDLLAPYGKMGLTNYLMQSIIFVPLFYGFGLGLARHLDLSLGLGLGVVFFYLQVLFSKWWLSRYMYGPFEWLWRSLTWCKWQPMVRK